MVFWNSNFPEILLRRFDFFRAVFLLFLGEHVVICELFFCEEISFFAFLENLLFFWIVVC